MAMKVYKSGDNVVVEKNSDPVVNIPVGDCSFTSEDDVIRVFNRHTPTSEGFDIFQHVQNSSGTAIGTMSQVLTYLSEFIKSSAGASLVPPIGETFERIAIDFKQDTTATTVLFRDFISKDILSSHGINTIEAVAVGTKIRIQTIGGYKILINSLDMESTSINGTLVTQVLSDAIIQLNSLFVNSGGAIGKLPTFTEGTSHTILLTAGNVLNHTITGDNIVSVSVDLSTTGTFPVGALSQPDFERRKLIGGSLLPAGSYVCYIYIYNYFGVTMQTLTVTVSASFSNTYSFEGSSSMCFYNAGTINSVPMYRPADGTGSSDAWSVMCWYKMVSAHKYDFNYHWSFGYVYGGASGGGGGGVAFQSRYNTLKLYYGNQYNSYFTLSCTKPHGYDSWHCALWTYSGNSTANSSFANEFCLYIDGVKMTLTGTQVVGSNGYDDSIEKSLNSQAVDMGIAGICSVAGSIKTGSTDPVDEVSCWDSELSYSDAVSLYNSGVPLDLNTFSPAFSDWWRMGDGTNDLTLFPQLHNESSGIDLTNTGSTVSNYISDVP